VRLSIVVLIVVIALHTHTHTHTQYFACDLWLTEGVKLLVTYECLQDPAPTHPLTQIARPIDYGPPSKGHTHTTHTTHSAPPLISAPQQYFVAVDSAALTSTLEQFVSARIPRHQKFVLTKVYKDAPNHTGSDWKISNCIEDH